MSALKIQVLGKGLIPRGYGLAPRKDPFNTSLSHISLILNTPGLSITYLNPETSTFNKLDKSNMKRVWDKYSNYIPSTTVPKTSPVVPEVKPIIPVAEEPKMAPPVNISEVKEEPKVDPEPILEPSIEKVDEVIEEKKDEIVFTIGEPPKNPNNYNNQRNKHNNNNNRNHNN